MNKAGKKAFACVSAASLLAFSCGGSSDADVKQPFGAATKNVSTRLKVKMQDGNNGYRMGKIASDMSIGGATYQTYQISEIDINGNPIPGTNTLDIFLSPLPLGVADVVTVAGLDNHTNSNLTVDPPLELNIAAPLNVAQQVSTTITGTAPGITTVASATATGTYTRVSSGETVNTEMGAVPDCSHYTAAITLAGDVVPDIFKVTIEGELWYNPTLGIVKYSIPLLGIEGNSQGTWDVDDPTGEYRTVKMTAVVNSGNPRFRLSSYDVSGQYDADKNTHAKMLLELRWADEVTAQTGTKPAYPMVNVRFETMIGQFPYTLDESPVSIFFPEENGKGYKYWYAFVDQAAKNEPGSNGISYNISVSTDTSITAPLRVTGRIRYRAITQ